MHITPQRGAFSGGPSSLEKLEPSAYQMTQETIAVNARDPIDFLLHDWLESKE